MKSLKDKKCRICKKKFNPYSSLSVVCSVDCAIKKGRLDRQKIFTRQAKAIRADTRERKKKLKTKSDYAAEAQTQVNKYVRLRDKGKPCVSCGKPDNGQHQRHASHYRSTAACSALRFNLKNIYASCQQCNTSKSGNILEYRIRLVKRYGNGFVEWLEAQNEAVKYEIDYLKRLKKVFAKRVRAIERRHEF